MYNGQVKLVDFGVAKASQSAQASSRVQGKFSYMAPEKLRGECGDRRSDLWSLGCVLWESLTLKRLFKGGSDSETMQQVLELPIRAPSQINGDVPADFDPIVLRALERDASRRYPTAKAIGADLEDVLRKHGYAAKNDLIAKYMQATFEPHIAARKKLLQQVSSKGRASRDVLEAAFNDRALASGTPIIPAGELRGTLVAPLQPVSAARDASSSHSLPHIPAHDASSSGSLPHIPAHDASSSHSLLHIPAHDASSSGSLPQIPAQGASSRGSLPQILAQGASSSGSLPQILAQGASRHHAPPGIPVTSTLSSALGAVGDGPTLVEPPIPLDRGWLQGPRKYAVAAGATIAILMVISVLLGRRGSEPAIELSSIPLTANPGDAPMRPSASQPPIAAPRAAALPTAAPPRPAASSATEPPPPPASSAPAPLPSRAPPPARREPAREAAVEARASVEPRHEVPSHNDRRDTARPAPTETPADLDIPVTRLVPSPAVRHAPIARSAPPPDRINPGEVSRAALQAWVHGDSRTAINLYRRTLQAAPSYAPAWRGIGLVYEKLGEKSAARAAFQRYLQLVPSAADAAGIRARLTPP
jgi:serine/threonine-protein kinase